MKNGLLMRSSIFAAVFSVAVPLIAVNVVLFPNAAYAHAGEAHDDSGVTVEETVTNTVLPSEIASIGGPFALVNHLGDSVTDQTYAGKHMLVFFGYSNCQIMCSISLKRIADALTILENDPENPLEKFNPLVVTVDPANDSPEVLRKSLAGYHSALTGLTGTLDQLKPVYKAYKQKPSVLDFDLGESAVVSHQSYFYLMGPDGKLQTFFPPVLNAESMAKLIKRYVSASS